MGRKPLQIEDAVASFAVRQHGNVTRRQLLQAGYSPRAIDRRLRLRVLERMFRGVYFCGHGPRIPLTYACAAVLACGSDALVAEETAAKLWRMPVEYEGPIQVVVVGRQIRGPAQLKVRRLGAIAEQEVRTIERVPITAPAFTLLEVAGTQPERVLARALNEARVSRIVRDDELRATIAAHPNRRGARRLARLLDSEGTPLATESEAEALCLKLMLEHGLRPDATQASVGPYRADFLFRGERLIVEVDGYRYHGTRHRFVRDRRRTADLVSRGFVVFPVSWQDLTGSPAQTMHSLAAALLARLT